MEKEISLIVKIGKDGSLQVIGNEIVKSSQGRPMGQITADITSSIAAADAAVLLKIVNSVDSMLQSA